ncbi:RNA-directed DNA polymerase, eukaryota, reverse transcriptase zinc-binding domain protein, partial [Tanacetum coccineum]
KFEAFVKDRWAVITDEDSEFSKPLHIKLKDLKSHLKLWFSHTKETEFSRKASLLATLRDLEKKIDDGHASDDEKATRINKLQELDNLENLESMDLVQKARVKWDVEGDENSNFFHGLINSRRKSQMINGIMHEGVWLSEPKDIKEAFLNFYKDKFSCHDSHISFPSFVPIHRLNNSDHDFLEDMVSMDEIKMAVWDCGSHKAPGPDGYTFMLIKKIWDLLKHDIQMFVVNFFSTGMFPQGANSAFITLIPKVDFEKAFDSFSWRYLDYVLDKLGFGIRWRNWINNGLMSARTSILINGNPSSEFSLKRGLRQGDPLSPFLFIIAMEGLHMALNDGIAANMFHGVKIGSNIHLSHLFYADDVIILSEWNQSDMENIIRILNIFYIASGLKINIHKSNVFGVGVSSSEIVSMAACTGCEAGSLPFSYLGLSIGSNMHRIVNWQVITDRFKARLSRWKANMLFIGGRMTLIKFVLGSPGIYYLSIFKAPESVVNSLESMRAAFFSGSSENTKKLAWVKWLNILALLDKGGLGIRSLSAFNKALLLKWRWHLLENPPALWVYVIKAIYGEEAGFNLRVPLSSIRFRVGDGSSIRKDTWLGNEPLCIRYNRLFHLANSKDCSIQDRIANGSWNWDWNRPLATGRSKSEFDKLILDIANLDEDEMADSDSCIWSLSHDGNFSVNMVRKFIDDLSLPTLSPSTRWYTMIPKKVNIFMWRMFLDRLPNRLNLSLRGLDLDSISCMVCNGNAESNAHIFFKCDTAFVVWHLV